MKFLIRLLARTIAGRLQQGNARAGILGSVLGALAGVAAAYALYRAEVLDTFRYAAFVLLALPGALCGALIGSALPASAVARTDRAVRINNLNRGLVPLFAFCVFAGLAVLATVGLPGVKAEEKSIEWKVAAGCGLLALLAGMVAARAVLFVDVTGDGVIVRRLFGSRLYPRNRIKEWGFEVSRGKLVQTAPEFVAPILIAFDDGFTFEAPAILPATAVAIERTLSSGHNRVLLHAVSGARSRA
jgi:hypothetical protein